MDGLASGEPSSFARKRRARVQTITTYLISFEGGSGDIDKAMSIQSSPKKKIKVWIWKVPPSEDKAKSDIRQVLLTNDKAKDMEG